MNNLKKDFPLLDSSNLIYFDNAATVHKPQSVIDTITRFYQKEYAMVHRSIYHLAEEATERFEGTRNKVASFIGALPEEIIFTQGTTHGINFVATAWALKNIKAGDTIVLTELEHHSNLIPWQQVAQHTGAQLVFIPCNPDGILQMELLPTLITDRTKLVSVVHTSHVLGVHNDIKTISNAARAVGALVLIDAAQSIGHQAITVTEFDADFLVFSGHKIGGPTGIGVLYIKKSTQPSVPPYQFGGGMVFSAGYDEATWNKAPYKYEAGTPPIAQVIGLGAAIDYINSHINFDTLRSHEAALCTRAIQGLQQIPDVTVLGPLKQLQEKGHLISFVVKGHHHHDVGAFLNSHNIAVRTGHFCAQPVARKFKLDGAIRISFFAYNTLEEVGCFIEVMRKLK